MDISAQVHRVGEREKEERNYKGRRICAEIHGFRYCKRHLIEILDSLYSILYLFVFSF